MALDEALLEFVQEQSRDADIAAEVRPLLIVRTYTWEEPTVSLGVHQQDTDFGPLTKAYQRSEGCIPKAWVRRPTGGRAILHGQDVSFSFVTNVPDLLAMSVQESYNVLTEIVMMAFKELNVPVLVSEEESGRAYVLSSLCFETQTPSDVLDTEGNKIAGSAQMRKQGGLLQHGAAFLSPYLSELDDEQNPDTSKKTIETIEAQSKQLSEALFISAAMWVNQRYGQDRDEPIYCRPFPQGMLADTLREFERNYAKSSAEIVDKVSTISGSHFSPASS